MAKTIFVTTYARRRYLLLMVGLAALATFFAVGLLVWKIPVPMSHPGFWRIVTLRQSQVLTIAVVALCQALATVSFQTVTNNRLITPSVMGFEALYVSIQTTAVYLLGAAGVIALQGVPQFLLQIVIMVIFSVSLYSWLLSGKLGNLHIMLLAGIVIGGGMKSVASFMQRLLSPSEFDVLSARLFGNISNAQTEYLPIAIPLSLVGAITLYLYSQKLNVMSLGRDISLNLGLKYQREMLVVLGLVSILMSLSTALVGPMTFLGFLIATLAYQIADTFDHRYLFPAACLTAFVVLAGSYFVMGNIFYAEGSVSIIIELVGGSAFLIHILRKGRL
ncbi:MAG: iron chelate uptake ABC transporter family permease subunit [Propionibacteriaceae bacterium]